MKKTPKKTSSEDEEENNSTPDTSSNQGGSAKKGTFIVKVNPKDKAVEMLKGGNNEGFAKLVDANLDLINELNNNTGKFLIGVAAEEQNEGVLQYLIDKNAILDGIDTCNMAPVLYAAKTGHVKIMTTLVQAGAKVKIINPVTKENAMFYAVRGNHIDCVKQLHAMEVPFEWYNYHQETPLFLAIKREYYELATLLISYGADLHCRIPFNNTPLHMAVQDGRMTTVNYILKQEKLLKEQTEKNTVPEGRPPLPPKPFDLINDNGETPLIYACKYGHQSILSTLLSAGAEVHTVDNFHRNALMTACMATKYEIVDYLLDEHEETRFVLDLNASDRWGYTALSFLCRVPKSPNLKLIERFLKQEKPIKCDLQHRDRCGNNLYMNACIKQHLEVAAMLLRYGVAHDLVNIDKQSALDLLGSEEEVREQHALICGPYCMKR